MPLSRVRELLTRDLVRPDRTPLKVHWHSSGPTGTCQICAYGAVINIIFEYDELEDTAGPPNLSF